MLAARQLKKGLNMPRTPREMSSTGIYHVMSRGVEKRQIFLDGKDYSYFISTIADAKRKYGFKLLAWCLMPNHVHLLIQDDKGVLSDAMKSINGSYACHFNGRHGRVGHLFQGRFKSSPVEDEAYLLTVVAYIHDNPVKAGLGSLESYRWSSFHDYADDSSQTLTDTEFVLALLGGKEHFSRLAGKAYDILDFDKDGVLNPDLAVNPEIALILMGYDNPTIWSKEERNRVVQLLKKQGYTTRQISDAVGVSKSTVARICAS